MEEARSRDLADCGRQEGSEERAGEEAGEGRTVLVRISMSLSLKKDWSRRATFFSSVIKAFESLVLRVQSVSISSLEVKNGAHRSIGRYGSLATTVTFPFHPASLISSTKCCPPLPPPTTTIPFSPFFEHLPLGAREKALILDSSPSM